MNRATNINKLSIDCVNTIVPHVRGKYTRRRSSKYVRCSVPPICEYTNRRRSCFTRTGMVSVGPGETGVSLVLLFTYIVRKTRVQNSAFDPFARVDQKSPRVLDDNHRRSCYALHGWRSFYRGHDSSPHTVRYRGNVMAVYRPNRPRTKRWKM